MDIRDLVWDPGNVAHIARHGVTVSEAEDVVYGVHVELQTYAGRSILIGATSAGRMVAVILEPTDPQGTYYVVTARSASRKERRYYQSQTEGPST
jgi:uncharacterized DUF497 family protein